MTQENDPQLVKSVLVLTICRLIVNITRRFAYPFLLEISRQLQVGLGSVQSVIALQAAVGVTSPVFGPFSERYGRKRVLMGALLLIAGVALIGAALPRFWMFAGVMITFGFAKVIFDPAMSAYLADRVPYQRRAMAMGTTELAWAGSLIVSAPVVGVLLNRGGLQAVFGALGAAAVLVTLVLWRVLPSDSPAPSIQVRSISPLLSLRLLRRSPVGIGAMGYTFLLMMANDIFYINYGAWMEQSFGLVLVRLGAVTTVIALAEVLGEGVVIAAADRIGKRRLALLGAILSSTVYLLMPFLSSQLGFVLVGLFALFLTFETAIVSALPLFSEVMPDARAVMMSGNASAASIGRFAGAAVGSLVFGLTEQFVFIGVMASVLGYLAAFCLWRFVPEQA